MSVIKSLGDYFEVKPAYFMPFVGGVRHGEAILKRAHSEGKLFPSYGQYAANAFFDSLSILSGIGLVYGVGRASEFIASCDLTSLLDFHGLI